MTTGIDTFEHSLQTTDLWLKDLMARLGTEDRHHGHLALRTTLHALRDRLAVEEAAHLGAQLPMLVRGLYFEAWHLAGKPRKDRTGRSSAHVESAARNPSFEAESAVRAVFGPLAERVSAGEIEDVKSILPRPVRAFWPG